MNRFKPAVTEAVRWRRASLAAVAAAFAALPPASAEPSRENLLALSASVLKIEVMRADGGYALGSGVVVARDKVVTNCHVTREGTRIHVLRGGLRWPVALQAVDAEHDLCVLDVPQLGADAVQLGHAAQLKVGQPVTAIGFTGGMGIQRSAGDVVALYKWDGSSVIQSSNWFTSGASGGGLFDDDMRLVGILTFRLRGGEAHYFAAPVEWVRATLADSDAFRAVAPLKPDAAAYWQRPLLQQPGFLQANVLEKEGRWEALATLAARWVERDAADPQAWYAQGLALEGLARPSEAERSFERSLDLDPDLRSAWLQLGLLAVRQGRLDRAREARARLEALRSDLATELDRAIAAPPDHGS